MSGPLVTARAVAELLGVSTETVLRWTRRGELPALRLPGGSIRYRPDEIEEWLDQRATTSAADTVDRELSDARASRARRGSPYRREGRVTCDTSDARRPLATVATEEDSDATDDAR